MFAWCGAAAFALSLLFFLYAYLVRFDVTPPDGPVLRPILVDALLFTLFALHHSMLARDAVKARLRALVAPPIERSVYTWTASLLFVLVCAMWQLVPGELYRVSGRTAWIGYAVQLLGIVVTLGSSARLDVLDLAGVRSVVHQQRDPAPARVPLETRGWYGVVRHPVYFGWLLFVFAAPHMTFTRLVFAIVSTLYLVVAIPFEERSLIKAFGADYRAYQAQVRWRMVPGVY